MKQKGNVMTKSKKRSDMTLDELEKVYEEMPLPHVGEPVVEGGGSVDDFLEVVDHMAREGKPSGIIIPRSKK
jgi:hypothetical protein